MLHYFHRLARAADVLGDLARLHFEVQCILVEESPPLVVAVVVYQVGVIDALGYLLCLFLLFFFTDFALEHAVHE